MRYGWLGLLLVSMAYGWYAEGSFQLVPSYVIMNNSENTTYGYGLYTMEGRARVALSPEHGLDIVLQDTLRVWTNISNTWDIRRLLWKSTLGEDQTKGVWTVQLGRDLFRLDGGSLFARRGDGLMASLFWNGIRVEGCGTYAGWTEWVMSNRPYATLTNERVETGLVVSFPLWVFSFVHAGVAGSVDLRTNSRTSMADVMVGVQGSIGAWAGYTVRGWYEMGEVALTNLNRSDGLSAWAGEVSVLIGKKTLPWQGMVRWVAASGENPQTSGWNRFLGMGDREGPLVLLHPVANLSMVGGRITWRPMGDVVLLSGIYDALWRLENKDIVLTPLYGDGYFVGQEMGIESVFRPDPNVSLFVIGGVFFKGDAFAINREKLLYQVMAGLTISL